MIVTGLSGDEIFCLAEKGWGPGNIVVGNSVQSLGTARGISSWCRKIAGGEVNALSDLICESRLAALHRMETAARNVGSDAISGVTSDVKSLSQGLEEFNSTGSMLTNLNGQESTFFSTACSGQDLYCQIDSYHWRHRFRIRIGGRQNP